MSHSDPNKKYKIPKKKTLATTKPESSSSKTLGCVPPPVEHVCPLLAKDSEWVDIVQSPASTPGPAPGPAKLAAEGDATEEEVLQLYLETSSTLNHSIYYAGIASGDLQANVECEDRPRMKPLAIMFPGLLDKDPQTLRGMLNRAMSTTEVTRQLVDLGQKANFEFMKKTDRLIPPEKKWLESVTENSNSTGSLASSAYLNRSHTSSSYEASDETSLDDVHPPKKKKRPSALSKYNPSLTLREPINSDDTIDKDSRRL